MARFLHGTNQTETSSRNSATVLKAQRERKNGWTCPWHPLQLIAWFWLSFFAVSYFGILVFYLPNEWKPAGWIIPGGFYVIHIIVHLLALSIDPADPNIRQGHNGKGIFDRNIHAHVIENDHCRICQADVFPKSKHCSTCNKCVSDFDHHCKWLNTCVGGRNYKLFVTCIASAFVGALIMSAVTMYLFVSFFTDKESLLKTQSDGKFNLFAPVSETVFIIFIGISEALYLLAIGLLGHLLGFHCYLIYLNISTYEYIVNARDRKTVEAEAARDAGTPMSLRRFRNNKIQPSADGMESGEVSVESTNQESATSSVPHSETTVKVMNEISSKAAKRNSTNALYSNHRTSLEENQTEMTIPQKNSSSESLQEHMPEGIPVVTVHSPSGKQNDKHQPPKRKGKQNGTNQPTKEKHNYENKSTKPNEDSNESEGEELQPVNSLPIQQNFDENNITKKQKKRKKSPRRPKSSDLPPLRPLPTLSTYSDSPC